MDFSFSSGPQNACFARKGIVTLIGRFHFAAKFLPPRSPLSDFDFLHSPNCESERGPIFGTGSPLSCLHFPPLFTAIAAKQKREKSLSRHKQTNDPRHEASNLKNRRRKVRVSISTLIIGYFDGM